MHSRTSRRTLWLRPVLVLLAVLLLAACSSGGPSPTNTPPPGGATSVPGSPAATASGIGQGQEKIGTVFLQLLALYQAQGLTAATKYATDQGLMTTQGEVLVTLVLDSSDADIVQGTALSIGRLGGRTTNTFDNRIELVMPAQALLEYGKGANRTSFFHDLAGFSHVRTIQRTPIAQHLVTATPSGASVQGGKSEGIAAMGADVWQAAGITGKGIKVGVLDTAFNGYKQFLAGANVTAQAFRSDGLIEDPDDAGVIHGSACAEIIHEMAPDAELFLAASYTVGDELDAFDWLVNTAHVSVISISIGDFGDVPKDDTDPVSRAVDRARGAGVFVSIAMGNEGSGQIGSEVRHGRASHTGHFAATFADADKDGFHDFAGLKTKDSVVFVEDQERDVIIILNWDDWKNPHVNYDLYLYDGTGKEIARGSDDQTKGFDPIEEIDATLPQGTYTLKVKKVTPRDPDLTFHLTFVGGQLEQVTPAGSLGSPADARGAIAVAAIDVKTNTVEPYSSQGPTWDGRTKPEVAGVDDAASFAYASIGRETFTGTSAAAPHVAGVAALYAQAFPAATPNDILAYLTAHAKQPEGDKGDNISGAGLAFLGPVPQGAKTTPAPTKAAATPPAPGTRIATPVVTRTATGSTATARTAASGAASTTPAASAPAATTAAGGIAFTDTFSSPSTGLPAAGYQNGEYHLAVDAGKLRSVVYPKVVGPVDSDAYKVTARRVSGADDLFMGLVLRYADQDNYILFAVTNTGTVAFYVRNHGKLQQVGTAKAAAIKANAANTLLVVGSGTAFTAFINGQPVGSVDIPNAPLEGAFGLLVSGSSTAGGEAAFDDYQVSLG